MRPNSTNSNGRNLLIASLIAGVCLFSTSAQAETTIRYLGHSGEKGAMDKVIEAFHAAHPDIKVIAEFAPSGPTYGQALMVQVQSGNAPDLFYANGGTGATESIIPLAKAGKLLNLADEDWVAGLPSGADSLYKIDGKVYGLLTTVSPHGILYKPETFADMGLEPPKTFADVLEICREATKQGKIGITLNARSIGLVADIISASNVYATTPDWNQKRNAGEVTFAGSAGWQKTLEMVRDMYQEKCFQPGAETAGGAQSFTWVRDQRALIAMVPSSAMGSITKNNPVGWKMTPFPGITEDQTTVAIGFQDGIVASADTKEKEAVLSFLSFAATPSDITRAKLMGSAAVDQFMSGNLPKALTGFAPFIDAGRSVARAHDTWPGGSAYSAMNTAMVAAMIGQSSIIDALKTVDDAWGK